MNKVKEAFAEILADQGFSVINLPDGTIMGHRGNLKARMEHENHEIRLYTLIPRLPKEKFSQQRYTAKRELTEVQRAIDQGLGLKG